MCSDVGHSLDYMSVNLEGSAGSGNMTCTAEGRAREAGWIAAEDEG